ncbi:MAG: aspartate dehydrogenase [Candidatus Omnitrophica bacterium]|nr:aspartate dehydrogenase [Candidatus Omnitrophota bacterium]
MGKLLKVGIVGCGAIGTSLAKAVFSDFSSSARLTGLYDTEIEKAQKLADKFNNPELVVLSLEDLINKADLVIEATKAQFSFGIAQKSINASRDIMVMSVGGLIQRFEELETLAKEKNARVFIPSGAICGIDGLKAASCSKINKVTLTTRKPPKAFQGVAYVAEKKIDLEHLKEDLVIFEGSAREATKSFPQNINVAATLSMAGIGPENTLVRIIASPNITQNIHEIEVESDAGKITTRTENVIHPDNPKTSYMAVLSAIAVLKQILEPIKIGA